METKATLRIPAVGWKLADRACSECLSIIDKSYDDLVVPGQTRDCYQCGNRLIADRTDPKTPSILEYFQPGDDEITREYALTEVLFDRFLLTKPEMSEWMYSKGLEGFEFSGLKGLEWMSFQKTSDNDAIFFVKIQHGVLGRCVLRAQE